MLSSNSKPKKSTDPPSAFRQIGFLLLAIVFISGCASGKHHTRNFPPAVGEPDVSVQYGKPNNRLDSLEHALMSPRRWVRKIRDQPVDEPDYLRSQPPVIAMEFLKENELSGINIDVDLYQPVLQWQRLKDASHVPSVIKYSMGTLSLLRDAVLPARLFNQDRYNHFTKTLSLNSHNDASLLYEAAMAKEHINSKYQGPATVAQRLPIGTTIARIRAGRDALDFARVTHDTELESELYPVVFSSVVSEALGDVGTLTNASLNFPQRIIARIGANQIGKAVGVYQTRGKTKAKSEPTAP